MALLLEELGIRGGRLNRKKVNFGGFSFGELYNFQYVNPISREKLDFWDKAPLMIFTGYISEHRILQGINLHFIYPVATRRRFVERLMTLRQKQSKAYLNLAWSDRIRRMGLSKSDATRVLIAHRNYSPYRVVDPKLIPFIGWKQAITQIKPIWYGASQNEVKSLMERMSNKMITRKQNHGYSNQRING